MKDFSVVSLQSLPTRDHHNIKTDSTSVKRPMKIHSAYLLQMLCSSRRKPDSRLSLPWPPSRPPAASWPRTSTTGVSARRGRELRVVPKRTPARLSPLPFSLSGERLGGREAEPSSLSRESGTQEKCQKVFQVMMSG
ncbi:pancreatic progenitor cell differentiation and proliferation factor-like protein isoform X4 [Onychostruthus taczanowskii]|uniref:pancreatic progenitor cell differentiation and proliferation factor-like protein isoform X4 n=1 Tax=Onychostruthus taczanowskii TaxID=356909 RepID=UPI001B807036|nr:pancreatic progenitor cell differentiation and proliferation factor-like protein isoform X4 [Onychostruthus taczanowskii]